MDGVPGKIGGIGIPAIEVGIEGKAVGRLGRLVGNPGMSGGHWNPPGDEDVEALGTGLAEDDADADPRCDAPVVVVTVPLTRELPVSGGFRSGEAT